MQPTIVRRAVALAAAALMVSANAVFADTIQVDGDTATSGQGSTQACLAIGSGTTKTANVNLKYNGSNHFNDGTVTVTASLDGGRGSSFITVESGSLTLTGWGNGDQVNVDLDITIASNWSTAQATDPGPYKVIYTLTQAGNSYVADNSSNMNVVNINGADCPTTPANAAPVLGTLSFNPNPVNCQTSTTLTIPFTDDDSTSWYADIDWQYDGTFASDETTAAVAASPITATHTYAAPGTYTAAAIVTDDEGAASGVGTAGITVNQTYSAAFLAPIDASAGNTVIGNSMKAGRVVPIKVTLTDDCTGAAVTAGAVTISVKKGGNWVVLDGTDPVETYSDAGASNGQTTAFRYDGSFWIYNLDSGAKGWSFALNTNYLVYVNVDGIAATQYAVIRAVK